MASLQQEPAVVRADSATQMRAIAVTLVGVFLGYLALRYCRTYLTQIRAVADLDPGAAVEELGLLFRLVVLTLISALCAFALMFALLARRVLNEGRFPPRGLRVVRDTRVITGEAARVKGERMLVLAGTLLATSLCVLLWGFRSLKILGGLL